MYINIKYSSSALLQFKSEASCMQSKLRPYFFKCSMYNLEYKYLTAQYEIMMLK